MSSHNRRYWWDQMPRSFWLRLRERKRLRRSIFSWFGVSIALTSFAIYAGVRLFPGTLNWKLVLLLMLLCLWIASGAIARRLARPFDVLVGVANELGKGKLSARVDLQAVPHGEARVLGQTLNEMAARIEKQVSDQKALLAIVSHELRTPLARMRLLAEAGRTGDEVKRNTSLAALDGEVDEVDALVSNLLASTRIDFGGLVMSSLDASNVALRALETARVDPSILDVSASTRSFEGDATLVIRAIANLLDNAATHGRKVHSLRVFSNAAHTVFEVSDDGPGISSEHLSTLFDAFQSRNAQRETRAESPAHAPSLRLGLSLVKRIAEAHGGKAYAQNRTEGGAQLAIAFPRSDT
jgi:two-component system, OmpR family, sensor kinase